MSAAYMHIGIPVTAKKPNMTYDEGMKLWLSNPDDYDFKIEYLKFEEGTPFPEVMHKNPHIAFRVDDMAPYLAQAQSILFGPVNNDDGTSMAFIMLDDTIIELYEDKK